MYSHIYDNNKDFLSNTALQYFGKKISYKELFDKVDCVAAALTSRGIKEGDNVILLMTSCPELVYLILALNKIGAVANMINPLFSPEQIRDRINDTDAELLIVLNQLYGLLDGIQNDFCIKQTVVIPIVNSMPFVTKTIAGVKLKKNIIYTDKIITWKQFVSSSSNSNTRTVNKSENAAIMVYSSGTTGASKGIVLTNKGINATIAHYELTGFKYSRNDVNLQIVPTWFSTGAIVCLLMPLCLGISVVTEPVFSEENFTKDILKYKPNLILGATSLWLYFLNHVKGKRIDLSFLTYPITGGEKILADTEKELNDTLNAYGCKSHMVTGYGMCELGSTATSTSIEHYKYGSAGYPIKDVVVAAYNVDTNEECKYFERGEIRVLTPARMKEYYKKPEATAEFFWKDAEGREWGCTGDVGYVDEDGFVFIEGRANDCFTSAGGEKIYNFDIENIILEVPEVLQCKVVGRSIANGAEEPVAFVLIEDKCDREGTISKILYYCKDKLNKNSLPADIKVLDKFPVKPSGKRDIELLRKMAQESK